MPKRIIPVVNWLLEQSPKVVRKLERESGFVLLGDSEKLGLEKVRLIVPEGIEVYHAIGDFRNKGELFFTTRGENAISPVYCSYVESKNEGLNYDSIKNIGKLLEYPWYYRLPSSRIFERLSSASKKTNLYLIDFVQHRDHPFLRRK